MFNLLLSYFASNQNQNQVYKSCLIHFTFLRVRPRIRFLDPPFLSFFSDFNYFQQKNIYLVLFQGQVRSISGPSDAARTCQGAERCGKDRPSISTIFNKISIYLELGQIWTFSRPRAAAKTGQGAQRCGQDRIDGARALRQPHQLYPCDACTKLIERGGGSKNRSVRNYPISVVNFIDFNFRTGGVDIALINCNTSSPQLTCDYYRSQMNPRRPFCLICHVIS